jgi:galactofuranosylgalactofuranosylrhamnosyl-N-acetylglucosaminyl-diphospho-decaprenol beta-1,5/1,6-galactofuranosyltransferase
MLDDDIVLEPEALPRLAAFARHCLTPTIVGGQMFSLFSQAELHSFGEAVDPWRFWWGPARHVKPQHDLSEDTLRGSAELHRRVDVDYNGWFACLIPREVIETTGLSLPLFLKWDDAEYSLRAGRDGYPTVSLPGSAVWHVPWTDKTDNVDWTSYFHQRNRAITALLHSPFPRGGGLLLESLTNQLKHIFSMQYSTARLRLAAYEDVLLGPDVLHDQLSRRLNEVRAMRSGFTDAVEAPHPGAFPALHTDARSLRSIRRLSRSHTRVGTVVAALRGLARHSPRLSAQQLTAPQVSLAHMDAKWWSLINFDSALVSAADGQKIHWYRRDSRLAASLAVRSVLAHARLAKRWAKLSKVYRRELTKITSVEDWARTFKQPS